MKKCYALLGLLLLILLVRPVAAEETFAEQEGLIHRITLEEVKVKIKQKDHFYLFIGREDNVDAQLAMRQLAQASQKTGRPIYVLNTKGIDGRSYKAFSKKYAIRSHSYLSYFANRQQLSVYHNNWRADDSDLLAFLQGDFGLTP